MFTIAKRKSNSQEVVLSRDGEISFVNRLFLPFIRRTHKYVDDLLSGQRQIPRHLGSLACSAFLVGAICYGVSVGGHSRTVLRDITSAAGFAVEEIKVSGNVETSDIDVLQELGLDETSSLLTLDLSKAHERLASLPWIEGVELLKVYPATLHVKLNEREAFAIWQHGDQLSLIDKAGSVIVPYDGIRNEGLPFFVGLGAEKSAVEIRTQLAAWPDFYSQIQAMIRVADRRWDLRLQNGITLQLPEVGIDKALSHFKALDETQEVLKRDIASVDLRLLDRVTIRLTPEALERRKTALAERSKQLKREEKT